MKKEQIDNKFIICRTQEEVDFIVYWTDKLLGHRFTGVYDLPILLRTKEVIDYEKFGYASPGFWKRYGYKEEECSVLFGNLIRRWKHDKRTT